jgi:ABC-type sugar transport system ATPase subunit
MTLADKIVVLRAGRVEQIGAPMDLYHKPANLFVAGFIGSPKMNFLEIGVQDGRCTFKDGSSVKLEGPADRMAAATTLGVRADQLRLAPADKAAISGEVSVVERLGDSEFAYVRTSWGQEIIARFEGGTNLPIGEKVGFALSGRTHFFDSDGKAIEGLSVVNS